MNLSRSERLALYPPPVSVTRQLFAKRLFRTIDKAIVLLPDAVEPDVAIAALSKLSQRASELASLIGYERDVAEGGAL